MLERAKYLLVSEMATARNMTSETAETLVVKSLAKAKLQFPVMQRRWNSKSSLVSSFEGTSEELVPFVFREANPRTVTTVMKTSD